MGCDKSQLIFALMEIHLVKDRSPSEIKKEKNELNVNELQKLSEISVRAFSRVKLCSYSMESTV